MLNTYTETWRIVEAWANLQIEEATRHCIMPGVDERKADHYRSRIQVLKELINLPKEGQDA